MNTKDHFARCICHLHQEVSDHGGGDLAHAGEDPDRPEHEEDAVPEPQDGEGLQG